MQTEGHVVCNNQLFCFPPFLKHACLSHRSIYMQWVLDSAESSFMCQRVFSGKMAGTARTLFVCYNLKGDVT